MKHKFINSINIFTYLIKQIPIELGTNNMLFAFIVAMLVLLNNIVTGLIYMFKKKAKYITVEAKKKR